MQTSRLEQLERLDISGTVLRLACRNPPNPVFAFRCGEPLEEVPQPQGPPVVPLWQCDVTVTGCRVVGGLVEFIRFSIEHPDEYEVVGGSEQSLLGDLFSDLIEDSDWSDEDAAMKRLRAAAWAVRFRYLDELMRFQKENGNRPDYRDLLHSFLQHVRFQEG